MSQLDKIYDTKNKSKLQNAEAAPETVFPLYGEITRSGVETILDRFPEYFSNPEGVFYDLGSGFGKMVAHVALVSHLKRVVGVEYYPERHQAAIEMASGINFPNAQPEFVQGDIFELEYPDATVVYVDNTCTGFEKIFSEEVVPRLPSGCLIVAPTLGPYRRMKDKFSESGRFKVETTYIKDRRIVFGVAK